LDGPPRPALAVGSGIAAGLATLGLIWLLLVLTGGSDDDDDADVAAESRVGSTVSLADLEEGDCMNFASGTEAAQFRLIGCNQDHTAEVSGFVVHPDADGDFPGDEELASWLGNSCDIENGDYLGAPVLTTTLNSGSLLPDSTAWQAGAGRAVCYLSQDDGSPLSTSVASKADDFPRGEQVTVSRLIEGDCFTPESGTDAYDLNSNSVVQRVECTDDHNGVFFGRASLDFTVADPFPGDAEIGQATSATCSSLFADHFGKDSDGFNYRYWRPNADSWAVGDRTVLCAILDADPIQVPFVPEDFERFFDVAEGVCFNLGPEESPDTLRLDDQVRKVSCDDPHLGQMIGSGRLEIEAGQPFPADNGILDLAGGQCEELFERFVGVSPYESEYGNFPFWYPNEAGWEDNDRRYACAFLDEEPKSVSLQDISA
jgi:hypothetical protein